MRWISVLLSAPSRLPPSASTICPSRKLTRYLSFVPEALLAGVAGSVHGLDHLVGDVVLGVDVDGFLQDHVVLLCLGQLLDDLVSALEHLAQFLVLGSACSIWRAPSWTRSRRTTSRS